MLKFNAKGGIIDKATLAHLNTSHVKVQQAMELGAETSFSDLNTSHVKVQLSHVSCFLPNSSGFSDLNTSHVKVQLNISTKNH